MTAQRHGALLALLLCVFSLYDTVISGSKSELLFPHGAEFGDRNLDNESDDFNSVEVDLTTPVVFYGQNYTSIYVSWNVDY